MRILSILVLTILLVACQQSPKETDEWTDLFDGETLTGWTIRGGQADFSVQDGKIISNSVLGAPNVFLCTEKEYGDFILEYEVKIDEGINSGMLPSLPEDDSVAPTHLATVTDRPPVNTLPD